MLAGPDLTILRNTALASMLDKCRVLEFQEGQADAYGKPARVYFPGEEIKCGLIRPDPQDESAGAQLALSEATLRLPYGTQVKPTDKIQLTALAGSVIIPETYEVLGHPTHGMAVVLVRIKKATTP